MTTDEITARLIEARSGSPEAKARLFESVYGELKSLARRQLRLRGSQPTLGATALVHEAYLRLVDQTRADWNDRGHFFAVAARAMRQIAIDQARRKGAKKRGAGQDAGTFDDRWAGREPPLDDLLAIDQALTRLAEVSPRLVQVVELCFFAGLTQEEAAEALSSSPATVKRDWRKARALLHSMISPHD